jgi:hypothetical protein
MTASMDDGYNNDLGLLDSEVDPERKSRHQRTARVAMNYWVPRRIVGNELEGQKVLRPRIRARDPRVAARTMKQPRPDLGPPLP